MANHFKAEKFIKNIMMFYNLKNMNQAYLDGFDSMRKNLNSDQQKWVPYIDAIKKNEKHDDIRFSNLREDDQGAVYNWLQNMLYNMDSDDRLMHDDKKAQDFVNKYYGPAFEKYSVQPIQEEYAQNIAENIQRNKGAYKSILGIEDKDLDKLSKKLEDGTYTQDQKTIDIFKRFLGAIENQSYQQDTQIFDYLPDCLKEKQDIFSDSNDMHALAQYIQNNKSKLISDPFKLNENELDIIQNELNSGNSSNSYISTFLQSLARNPKHVPLGLPQILQEPVLDTYEANQLADYFLNNSSDLSRIAGLNESDIKLLADALKNETYQTDTECANNFEKILLKLSTISDPSQIPTNELPDMLKDNTGHGVNQDEFTYLYKRAQNHISQNKVTYYANTSVNKVNNANLNDFYKTVSTQTTPTFDPDSLNNTIQEMFETLANNEKLRNVALQKQPEIQPQVTDALNNSNYKEGKNIVKPKYADKKNFFERASDNIKSLYTDTLGKLTSKHKRHNYATNARMIVDGLIGKGVKPTDGTGKILDTLKSVRESSVGELPNQIKWIESALSEFKDKKFFAGALREGKKMNALVSEIIIKGVNDNKIEETQMALEMLAVMRYTSTTSSVRDELKKMDFTIFGDPNLSFNKDNKFIHSFMQGIDWALKLGTMAVFEVANIAKNKINQRGLKFQKGTEKLDKRIKENTAYKQTDKQQQIEFLMGFWNAVNNSIVSKDYNILKKHSNVQKAADEEVSSKIPIKLAGATKDIEYKTEQQKKIYQYINQHNVGRAA